VSRYSSAAAARRTVGRFAEVAQLDHVPVDFLRLLVERGDFGLQREGGLQAPAGIADERDTDFCSWPLR